MINVKKLIILLLECFVKGFFKRFRNELIFLLILISFIILYSIFSCIKKKKKNKDNNKDKDKFYNIINKEIKYKLIDDDINELQYNKIK